MKRLSFGLAVFAALAFAIAPALARVGNISVSSGGGVHGGLRGGMGPGMHGKIGGGLKHAMGPGNKMHTMGPGSHGKLGGMSPGGHNKGTGHGTKHANKGNGGGNSKNNNKNTITTTNTLTNKQKQQQTQSQWQTNSNCTGSSCNLSATGGNASVGNISVSSGGGSDMIGPAFMAISMMSMQGNQNGWMTPTVSPAGYNVLPDDYGAPRHRRHAEKECADVTLTDNGNGTTKMCKADVVHDK